MLRILVVFIAPWVLASAPSLEQPDFRCTIQIIFEDVHGQTTLKTYYPNANSAAECFERAEVHKTNFAPGEVKSKKVTAKWEKTP